MGKVEGFIVCPQGTLPNPDPIQVFLGALAGLPAVHPKELPLLLTSGRLPSSSGSRLGTLANLRYHGGGPPYTKRGTNVFYPRKELLAWVEAMPLYRNTTDEAARKAGDARHRQDRHGMQTNDPE